MELYSENEHMNQTNILDSSCTFIKDLRPGMVTKIQFCSPKAGKLCAYWCGIPCTNLGTSSLTLSLQVFFWQFICVFSFLRPLMLVSATDFSVWRTEALELFSQSLIMVRKAEGGLWALSCPDSSRGKPDAEESSYRKLLPQVGSLAITEASKTQF